MNPLATWKPFRRVTEPAFPTPWTQAMDRFFAPFFFETNGEERSWVTLDARETPEAFLFTAEIPGLKSEDVNVSLMGDVLTISGEKRKEEKRETEAWHLTERMYGTFRRTFAFPVPVDPDSVDADLKNGVLTVKVMKSKKAQPKKIAVHAH